jgi:MFS transporter, FHS family, Na+ dependent glucose transporter 1
LQKLNVFIKTGITPSGLSYYSAYILLGLTSGFLGPVLPFLADQIKTTLADLSIIFVTCSIGYLIGAFFSGRAFGRWRGNKIITLAVLAVAGLLAMMPLALTLVTLIIILSILGFAQSAIDVGANTLILRAHGDNSGPYMNALHFFFGAGALLAPIVVAQVILHIGTINWVFWIFAIMAIPIALQVFFSPGPAQPTKPLENQPKVKINLLLVGSIMLLFVLYTGAEIGYGNWLFTYVIKSGLGKDTSAAYLTSAFWGIFTAGRMLGILLAKRFKPHKILTVDLAGCLISTGMILYFSESVSMLWIGTGLLGLSMASIFPTLMLFADEQMRLTSQVTSWFIIASSLGAMFLPWLIGQYFDSFGPKATMIIIFSDLTVALLLFLGLKLFYSRSQSQTGAL